MNEVELQVGAILLSLFAAYPRPFSDEELIESLEKSGTTPQEPWNLHELVKKIGLIENQQVIRIDDAYQITDSGIAWLRSHELVDPPAGTYSPSAPQRSTTADAVDKDLLLALGLKADATVEEALEAIQMLKDSAGAYAGFSAEVDAVVNAAVVTGKIEPSSRQYHLGIITNKSALKAFKSSYGIAELEEPCLV